MCTRACMQALPAFSPRSFARAIAAVTARASGGQRRGAHTAGSFAGVVRAFRCGRAVPRSPACHTPCGSRRRASSRACRSAADTGEAGLADGAETEGETEWQHALDNLQRPSTQELHPGLYMVATPIGNLEDITLRALRVLRAADAVYCEDTRHTARLLNYYGIKSKLLSAHAHNESTRVDGMLARVRDGQRLAVVSDAGVPTVSDPGGVLVAAAVEAGVRVVPVPGACAAVAGLAGAGLPTDAFAFVGFLPKKSKERRERLAALASGTFTLIVYVAPHDLLDTLRDTVAVLGGARRCCVARELTKLHEEFWRGSLVAAADAFAHRQIRGEITLLIEGHLTSADGVEEVTEELLSEALTQLLAGEGMSASAAAKQVAATLGVRRNMAYKKALELSVVRGPKEK